MLQMENLAQWQFTMRVIEKNINQFPGFHGFADVSQTLLAFEDLYIIFKEPQIVTNKIFQFRFLIPKIERKDFYVNDPIFYSKFHVCSFIL